MMILEFGAGPGCGGALVVGSAGVLGGLMLGCVGGKVVLLPEVVEGWVGVTMIPVEVVMRTVTPAAVLSLVLFMLVEEALAVEEYGDGGVEVEYNMTAAGALSANLGASPPRSTSAATNR